MRVMQEHEPTELGVAILKVGMRQDKQTFRYKNASTSYQQSGAIGEIRTSYCLKQAKPLHQG
jgi:hypothetical protein